MIGSTRLSILSLVIPFAALLIWTVQLELHKRQGEHVRVRVTGYDPRDLLAGHYLRYHLDLGHTEPCDQQFNSQERCVCLGPVVDTPFSTGSAAGSCKSIAATCRTFLRGTCADGGRFQTGLEQFYIPERLAPVLMTVPADSNLMISVNSNGDAQAVQFFVGDEDVSTYAERMLEAKQAEHAITARTASP